MRVHKKPATLASPVSLVAMVRACRTLCQKLPRLAVGSFLLALPLGYYPNNPDSVDFGIGAYGGGGQVASVIRGCDGTVHQAEASKFKDVSVSAWAAVPPGVGSPVVVGVQGGRWESTAGFAEYIQDGYGRSPDRDISFSYTNPHVNFETKNIGLGVGYMFGDVPQSFDSYRYGDQAEHRTRMTGHIRLGPLDKGYFQFSHAESTPLVSAGGMTNLGIGYAAGRSVRLYSGLSGGFYDGAGFLQQGRLRINKNLAVDASLRLGSGGGVTEHAFSGGIVYRFGLR
jgi:hypothetical protein